MFEVEGEGNILFFLSCEFLFGRIIFLVSVGFIVKRFSGDFVVVGFS